MIHEVDSALRTLIEREADGMRDVEIVFEAPTREWAGRRNSPTVDVYLYDIREDLRRRERGMHQVYENNVVVSRHLPPRHFKLSYLVTAWTQRPEDEHRLLSSLLTCFVRYEALPRDVLTGPLTELGLPIPVTIALPPPEDRAFADVWSALGGELKPSLDLVVTTPMDSGQRSHVGPPVQKPIQIDLGGMRGRPGTETTSDDDDGLGRHSSNSATSGSADQSMAGSTAPKTGATEGKPVKTGGRPGPRVAMTRTRQPKKST
ncbi:MAG: DUF4255 domain-containing protein [Microlunatus sp.]